MEKMLHAYILTGASRETLEQEARRMAALAQCSAAQGGEPCRACRDCRKVLADIHPDVTRIVRQLNTAGKLRQELTVDQIRALGALCAVPPNEGQRSVYIFPEAERMNAPAQNAFLKLLEEPPEYVCFLLCAENPALLLPTLRSRCALHRLEGDATALPPAAMKRARELLDALDEPAELLRRCTALEKLEGQELRDVIEALRRAAPEKLTGRALLALEAELNTFSDYLRANVSPKHVLGVLATYEMRNDL